MAAKVAAGAQPWTNSKNALLGDGYTDPNWSPRPLQTVIRGGDGQNFAQMVIDMQRAYQTALAWKVTGNVAYANAAVRILNAWSYTNTVVTGNSDRFLASGLYGFDWAASADIMKSYSGWAAADVTQFENYLLNIYYPMQHDFLVNHNGASYSNYWANWDLANVEGMMGVGIFTDRQDIYDEAVSYLHNGVGNGTLDKAAYYRHPGNLMQWQESGRDQGHTVLGMALFGHVAQMAWNQGLDLFSYNNYQFLAAAEYVAKYNLGFDVPFQTYVWGRAYNGAWPFDIQTGVSPASRGNGGTGYALIVSHYVQRLGMAAPYSLQRVAALGSEGRNNGDDMGWGTLTYSLDPFTTPQAPRGLTAKEAGASNIQLDWFGGANDTSYNLYRSTSANGTYTLLASGLSGLLTYTDRNLADGTYYYKATGVSGATETAASNIAMASARNLLTAQLPFNESSGTSASDGTGNGNTGTLNGGASWSTGKSGNAVLLNGSNGYISFPTSPIEGLNDFSISTWVYLNANNAWGRVFDFGDGHGRYMYLTTRNGNGVPELATSTNYAYNQQSVAGNSTLPTNQWVHLAVTWADHVAKIYVNGVAVGGNADMDFPPSEIWRTTNNWIGRSAYGSDPYLNGKVDDFRAYRGSLTAGQVYQLATGNTPPAVPAAPTIIANAVGANRIDLSCNSVVGATSYTLWRSTTSGGPYSAVSTMLIGTSYSDTGLAASLATGTPYYYVVTAANNGGESTNSTQGSAVAMPPLPSVPGSFSAKSISPTSLLLTWNTATNAASYKIKRSLTAGGPYATIATGITTTTYTDAGLTTNTPYFYVVTAVNASGESAASAEGTDAPSDRHARLTFHESAGTSAEDITGNGWNGTLVNGPLWTPGKMGTGVDLDGSNDYVSLPTGIIGGLNATTLSAWVNLDSSASWQRIFDFGTGTTNYMFLTALSSTASTANLRFAIRTPSVSEQLITTTTPIATGNWVNVAVVLNGSVGTLYVNGTQVAQNTSMTLNPTSLGSTTLNYLGKSQFSADPYLNGKLDDFRIYTRALSSAEVGALVGALPTAPTNVTATRSGDDRIDLSWSAVSGATGYTILRSSTSGGPYTLLASHVTGNSYVDAGLVPDVASGMYYYILQAENNAGEGANSAPAAVQFLPPMPDSPSDLTAAPTVSGTIQLTWPAATNAASYRVSRASSIAGTYTVVATGVMGTTYSDPGLMNGKTYYYKVSAINAAGTSAESPVAAVTATDVFLRLKFDEASGSTAADASGHANNGTLVNGPIWSSSGKLARSIDLDGNNDYVLLPPDLNSSLTTMSISAWINVDAVGTWQRIFDIGSSDANYMFLTTQYSTTTPNRLRFGMRTPSVAEQTIDSSTTTPIGSWAHVALVLSGSVGTLFLNGVQVGQNTATTITPAMLGATTENYLGHSQFSADPYYNGRIDDFRIYSRSLTAAEVNTLATSTVPSAPANLTPSAGNQQVTLNWNAVSTATGYAVLRATKTGGPYTILDSNVAGTSFVDTGLTNGTRYYYVVRAINLVDQGPQSAEASATPTQPTQLTASEFKYQSLPYELAMTFNTPVSFVAGDLAITPLAGGNASSATSSTWNSATNTQTFVIAGPLPDGYYTATLPGGYSSTFFVLAGDANRDHVVDSADFNIFLANYGQSGRLFGDGDFSYDGKVDAADFNILAGRFGATLTPPQASMSVQIRPVTPASAIFAVGSTDDDIDEGVLL